MPDLRGADPSCNFHFVERDDPEKIVATLVKLVQERIPERFRLDPIRDVQVLCPMNRGSLGVRELNTALQKDGIGPKYSRNMLMDIFHPDFRDSIAIDQRILSISRLLELRFKNYNEHENFYLDVADGAGLSGWELDRLMYRFTDEFLDALKGS